MPRPPLPGARIRESPLSVVDEKELIVRYLPLVRNVVDRVKLNLPAHVDADDLYPSSASPASSPRCANSTRSRAARSRATPPCASAVPFSTRLRRMDWCPRRARARSRKLKTAIDDVEQQVGRPATDDEGVESPRPRRQGDTPNGSKRRSQSPLSPSTMVPKARTARALPSMTCWPTRPTSPAATVLEKAELLQLLTQRIAELPDIPRKILAMCLRKPRAWLKLPPSSA